VQNIRAQNIAATGTLTVGGSNSSTRLWSIVVNTGAASAVATVYDGTAATGRKIATIDASASKSLNYGGAICKDGVTLVLSGGNADVTVNAG
jgi:hypothetical protein